MAFDKFVKVVLFFTLYCAHLDDFVLQIFDPSLSVCISYGQVLLFKLACSELAL